MTRNHMALLLSATLLIAIPVSVNAQTCSQGSNVQQTTEGIQKRDNEFGIWGGISVHSPTWIGGIEDARFGNIGLRYGRVLAASKSVAFEWTIDSVPVAVLSNPRLFIMQSGSTFAIQRTRKSAYAFGVSPIGLKLNFRRNKRVEPFVASTGGFLFFNEDVPVAGAARFNFTFDFQGGVQIVNGDRRSYTIGYKFNHISNGFHSDINPGVDLHMLFFGFSVFK